MMDAKTNELCVEWAQVLERLIELVSDLDVPQSIKQSERLIIAAAIIAAAAKQQVTIING
jgi:hypothetical protein